MTWWRRFANTLRPARMQHDIDRELAFHLSERADDLRADGVDDGEAVRRSRRQFGNVLVQAERTRDVSVSRWLEALLRDARHACRSLARTPGVAVTIVLTLALGIGANSAVFSALDAVLLRPLPFPGGDQLMRLRQSSERNAETNIAPIRLADWQRLNTTFAGLTGFYTEDVSETSGELPESVRRAFVAPRFFEVWGVPLALGRSFIDAEHRVGGTGVVVISARFWRTRLAAAPDVLQRTIRLGQSTVRIVGVLPASFLFPDRDVDLFMPNAVDLKFALSRQATWYTGIGRLQPGVSLEQARANLAAVQAHLAQQFPETDAGLGVVVTPLKESTVGDARRSLWLVFAGVVVLLLITCTNVAGLLLARARQRWQETALRVALGASRAAIASQVFIEALLLSLTGAALGLAVAMGAMSALRAFAPDLPRVDEIAINWRIFAYALSCAVAVALLCGSLPALRSSVTRTPVTGGGQRTQVSGRSSLQWALVGAQLALAVTLLAGAGLLVRSLQELSRVDAGFDDRHVLTFRVSGSFAETADYGRLTQRIDRSIDALRALPGVEAVATAATLPGLPASFESAFVLVEDSGSANRQLVAESRVVSPDYFATLRIPLLQGDACRRTAAGSPPQILVNASFASRYLADRVSPLGLHLTTGAGGSMPGRLIGVVGDARETGLDRAPSPTVYWCNSTAGPTPFFLVRASGEPQTLAQPVRVRVKALEPLRSVYDIAPLSERIGEAFVEVRLRTTLLTSFAVTALLLACVGIYGTLNYIVGLRRREIGLRLALGAVRRGIVQQFVWHVLRIATLACLAGLVLATASRQLLGGMLYGVSAGNPLVLALVVVVVLTLAVVAALVPALRAARTEPLAALREG